MNAEHIRVLVVEDEAAHAAAISRAFEGADDPVSIRVAASLKSFRTAVADERPDIVLMDLHLPDGRAIEALAAPAQSREFPVLIMTSFGSEALAVEAMKSGALDYLVKSPETFAGMPNTVRRALREWRTILDHRRMAEALRENEEKYRQLAENTEAVLWEYDIRNDRWAYVAPHVFELSGYRPEEWDNLQFWVDRIYAADRQWASQYCADLTRRGEPHTFEYRFVRKDGRIIWLRDVCSVEMAREEPVTLRGFMIDITERKEAELELQKLSFVVEQSPAAVVITDLQASIEYVNSKFTQVTGYTFEEVRGKNPRILKSGDMPPQEYQKLWTALLAGQEWHGEFLNRKKDGSLFWEHASISPLRNSQGQITHYVAVKEDVTARKNYEERLQFLATHDELTGLPNRGLLRDRISQAIRHAQRFGHQVAVLLLDLDRFKVINDSLGHAVGDELLVIMARRLKGVVREVDTVARLGGDEFVLLLTELASSQDVPPVAAKILRQLGERVELDGREISVAGSLGVSLYPRDGEDPETLLRNADMAMYKAKRDGSSFAFYCADMNASLLGTLETESALRQALERGQFCLHYQPKIDLRNGSIVGCEALIRWRHPQKGLLPPGQFIALAEEIGLIVPIGRWALEEACRQSLEWQAQGLPPLNVAVNLSARQFRKGDLLQTVREVLTASGLDPRLLELELTESMVMDDPIGAQRTMLRLKELGIRLSLDDFGTGYSSLNYLRRFPVDSLKIDRCFIEDVASDPSGASVVSSIVAIAHNLGLTAIAEGVESFDQLSFLTECGCDQVQGFLFKTPLPGDEFARSVTEMPRLLLDVDARSGIDLLSPS